MFKYASNYPEDIIKRQKQTNVMREHKNCGYYAELLIMRNDLVKKDICRA